MNRPEPPLTPSAALHGESAENSAQDAQSAAQGREGGISGGKKTFIAILVLAGLASLTLIGATRGSSPVFIWNDSTSMNTGIYWRIGAADKASRGSIVSVVIPEAAMLYAKRHKIKVGWDSFIKPIAAVAGDHVCVSLDDGLTINGERLADVRRLDSAGNIVAAWSHCRNLLENEVFLYSPRVAQSYDSRYFGPVGAETIMGVYEPLWTW